MTQAARRVVQIRDGLDAVADWEDEHGAFTDEEVDAARRRVADEVIFVEPHPA